MTTSGGQFIRPSAVDSRFTTMNFEMGRLFFQKIKIVSPEISRLIFRSVV